MKILGTRYKVTDGKLEAEKDGESFFYKKCIKLRKTKTLLEECASEKEKRRREKEILRHEIFHCFFFEAGRDEYAYDEDLILLLERISPKIFKALKKLDAL